MVVTLIALTALGGLAVWGHHTGWKIPKFSELNGGAQEEQDDWCAEHGVPESQCVECNPALLPRGKEYGWCKKHGVAECPLEHPDVAQLDKTPKITDEDFDRAERTLACDNRPENNPKCKLNKRRIQFASQKAVEKAGIDIAPVWQSPMIEAITANGEITYDQTRVARLSSRVSGTVWWVGKAIGDRVKRGDVLALIDAAEVGKAKSDLLQALALVEQKTRAKEAVDKLIKEGVYQQGSLHEVEANAALREAEIRLVAAEQALMNLGLAITSNELKGLSPKELAKRLQFLGLPSEMATDPAYQTTTSNLFPLRATLDGVVVACDVVAGPPVDTAKQLFVIADTSNMWLNLDVRLEDTKRLMLGQPVYFRPDAKSTEVFGSVAWISTAVDEKTRTVKVRAELPNPDGRLKAFTFGSGRIILREEKNAIVVPNEAVHWEGCCYVVFVRDKNYLKDGSPKVFHVRIVRPAAKDETNTEIIAGVLPGEVVASKGSGTLRSELLKNNLGEG